MLIVPFRARPTIQLWKAGSNLKKNLSCVHIPALTDVVTLEEEKKIWQIRNEK